MLKHWDYFNHAGIGPLAAPARDAVRAWAASFADESILGRDWFGVVAEARRTAARLIGCDASEVALLKNTSEGIAAVARGR